MKDTIKNRLLLSWLTNRVIENGDWDSQNTLIELRALVASDEYQALDLTAMDTENETFRINMGRPILRAKGKLVLPKHSLSFSCNHTEYIQVWSEPENPELMEQNKQVHNDGNRRPLDMHPHISSGMPCLGHYSQAWSQSISSGNIIGLTNIAKAFLNNWTPGDCYWDVNIIYDSWKKYFPEESFAAYLEIHRQLTNCTQGNWRGYSARISDDTEIELSTIRESFGISRLHAYYYKTVTPYIMRTVRDTESGHIQAFSRVLGQYQSLMSVSHEGETEIQHAFTERAEVFTAKERVLFDSHLNHKGYLWGSTHPRLSSELITKYEHTLEVIMEERKSDVGDVATVIEAMLKNERCAKIYLTEEDFLFSVGRLMFRLDYNSDLKPFNHFAKTLTNLSPSKLRWELDLVEVLGAYPTDTSETRSDCISVGKRVLFQLMHFMDRYTNLESVDKWDIMSRLHLKALDVMSEATLKLNKEIQNAKEEQRDLIITRLETYPERKDYPENRLPIGQISADGVVWPSVV